ncbi:hypothetical protein B0H21DRAFT_211430 [Amylocystis lapponica]|nr:hypothetical protein B0H21DRAFT_211430 [Amylocystis lapponica]
MSRPDAHAHEFESSAYEGRSLNDQSRDYGRDYGRDYNSHLRQFSRDALREESRDYAYYNANGAAANGATVAADRRSLTSGSLSSSGYGSFTAPRMFNPPHSAQTIGVGAGDSWGSKPAAYPASPSNNRTPADVQLSVPSLVHNHHPRPPVGDFYSSPLFNDRDIRDSRDLYVPRHIQQQPSSPSVHFSQASSQSLPSPTTSTTSSRSTLWWGELEPWMDEEYAKQVCNIMGWDPVSIKVPRPAPDPITGQQANNPGYCFLTFPSQTHAASVLSQINNSNNGNGASVIMPNSSKPFALNWASSVPSVPMAPVTTGQSISIPGVQNPQYPKEYSIFVGDLAPEVSNSDLVAVFRNPVLGLRNDREPRFIRPFLSCKSAKIMLDPVTGVSRGYGFVRFTDEADQQRALVEMHGLYCLSRPMRISPATAKFKPAAGLDFSQMPFPLASSSASAQPEQNQVTIALPLPSANHTKSVSAPLAGSSAAGSNASLTTVVSNSTSTSSLGAPSLSSGSSSGSSSSTLASATSDEVLKAQFASANAIAPTPSASSTNGATSSVSSTYPQTQDQAMAQRYNIPEESWKHHAQARAILSNLMGPNGEQLTSSDPYNTTVFVGGLSPLISEETLRTFFVPFGDIHYVKVPVGKHCGFVQFVRKPDAETAIEKMQGFPIGGSRIRLSWGRSQYKAAQAAAQAAQAAAFQAQYQTQAPPQPSAGLTPEQALQLLEKFGLTNLLTNGTAAGPNSGIDAQVAAGILNDADMDRLAALNVFPPTTYGSRQGGSGLNASAFSPFSPDPNYLVEGLKNQEQAVSNQVSSLPIPSKGYTPWYNSTQDEKLGSGSGNISPNSIQTIRPSSASQRYHSLFGEASRTSSRQEAPIARPDVSRRSSQEQYAAHDHDHDIMQDLNGTLASLSLDLDHSHGMWKTGGEGSHPSP